ncbi:hypothetical protein LguiB_008138 [Lonicera macranthoides]
MMLHSSHFFRRHLMECPQGLLRSHFEKVTESDPCLFSLSQQAKKTSVPLYFEPIASGFDDTNVSKGPHVCNIDWELSDFFDLDDAASPSGTQYSSSKNEHQDFLGMPLEHFSPEAPLPVTDASVMEEIRSHGAPKKCLGWDDMPTEFGDIQMSQEADPNLSNE